MSRSRLGLEDITSRSRSRDFSLVNIHAMHQACGYITKKIMDLTREKQVVKRQTSPVGVLNCDTAVSTRFLECLGLVSVLRVQRLSLVSVLKVDCLGLVT